VASEISRILNEKTNLGVEVDEPSEYKLLTMYLRMRYLFGDRVRVYISSSGRGYHFEAEGVRNSMEIRRWVGDCSGRMYFSEIRDNDNVLFHAKYKPCWRKWKWREEIDPRSLLSLPFFSRIPRGHYVRKRRR